MIIRFLGDLMTYTSLAREIVMNIWWYMMIYRKLWNVVNYGCLMIFLGYNSYDAIFTTWLGMVNIPPIKMVIWGMLCYCFTTIIRNDALRFHYHSWWRVHPFCDIGVKAYDTRSICWQVEHPLINYFNANYSVLYCTKFLIQIITLAYFDSDLGWDYA